MIKHNIFFILALAGFIVMLFFFFMAFQADGNPKFNFCLNKSYDLYAKYFMSKDGRIIDYERDSITTSEGQSYMLLQSLIVDDEATFNLIYTWTKNNLQRHDNLFSWLWGNDKKGNYRILDENSASDADVDIAFALILAYEKWENPKYLEKAIPVIKSIWNNETKRIGNYLVLMPGEKQASLDKTEVNPSYFSPYAFRYFQKYDDEHDWNCLIDSSYYYLNAVMSKTKTGLPPDWFLIENGQIVLENSPRSDFSYDAIRVFPRIYLDYIKTKEPKASPILSKSKFFIEQWENDKTFYTNYQYNGKLRDKNQFVGSIMVLLPVIKIYNPEISEQIYNEKVQPYLNNSKYWQTKSDYYGKNLLWFGYYLYKKPFKECKI